MFSVNVVVNNVNLTFGDYGKCHALSLELPGVICNEKEEKLVY
jgi:hypothetical protein